MQLNKIAIVLLMALNFGATIGQEVDLFVLDKSVLVNNRAKVELGDPELTYALKYLIKEAEGILADSNVYSVVNNDKPVGTIRGLMLKDYYSLALYKWPNPTSSDGMPYITLDGKVNPETRSFKDQSDLNLISNYIFKLGLAYYYTNDQRYVLKSLDFLSTFFLDEKTGMNPNFNFAQVTRGREIETGGNIVEANGLIKLIDGIQLMRSSDIWPADITRKQQLWFEQYLKWLVESQKGRKNEEFENNVGLYYVSQVVTAALFIGDHEFASSYLNFQAKRAIDNQINSKGELFKELSRATYLDYMNYSYKAFDYLKSLGDYLGVDLYNYVGENGGSLKKMNSWVVESYKSAVKGAAAVKKKQGSVAVYEDMLSLGLNGLDRGLISDFKGSIPPLRLLYLDSN